MSQFLVGTQFVVRHDGWGTGKKRGTLCVVTRHEGRRDGSAEVWSAPITNRENEGWSLLRRMQELEANGELKIVQEAGVPREPQNIFGNT